MTVADLSTIWVTANVPEKDTALVAKGQAVEVAFAAYPGEVSKARCCSSATFSTRTRAAPRSASRFQNPETRLKPNMFANVSFLLAKHTMPVVPTTALVLKDETDQVFVEVEPWVFEARPVEIGFQEGEQVDRQSGVKAGDRIVVKGGVLLND